MRVAGADVARGRWVVVTLDDGAFEAARIVDDLAGLVDADRDLAAVGVDIPIGLPPVGESRESDRLARARVGRLASSVFPAPAARLLEFDDARSANVEATRAGATGVSRQAFGLKWAIEAVADLAARDARVHEVHPEVSFAAALGRPLDVSKRTWNGERLRRSILADVGVELPDDLGDAGRAGSDDVLDATIAAWSASRVAAGRAECLPEGGARIGSIWV